MGSFGNPAAPQQVRETLAAAMDLGVTLFDTADIYGQGDSEREIGRHWRGWKTLKPFQRDEVLTAIVRNGDAVEVRRKATRGPATRAWIARELAPESLVPQDEAA